jgi:hypothetical protein
MIDKTEFIDIAGYGGQYAINKNGDVYSYKSARLLKPNLQIGKYRYYRVNLFKNNKYKTHTIHRLVAIAFIPNLHNLPFINHINGVKTDNKIENLEWVTNLQNMQHANNTGLFNKELQRKNGKSMGFKNRKISYSEAEEIRRLYKSGKYTQRKLAKMYGVCFQNVNLIVNNKTQLTEVY